MAGYAPGLFVCLYVYMQVCLFVFSHIALFVLSRSSQNIYGGSGARVSGFNQFNYSKLNNRAKQTKYTYFNTHL